MEEVALNENKSSDSGDSGTVSDNPVSDSGEPVENVSENILPSESPDTKQSESGAAEQSGEGAAETVKGESAEPESEEESEKTGETGTGEESEETGETGTGEESEETGETGTEEESEETGESGTGQETEGTIIVRGLSAYLSEEGYEESAEVTACLEVLHEDALQIHTDLQLLATYGTGIVVLIMFLIVYKVFKIFF